MKSLPPIDLEEKRPAITRIHNRLTISLLFAFMVSPAAIVLRLGFFCPRCGKPLYEPRGFINLAGLCSKCRKGMAAGAS
jgi:hypothetical protein